VISRCAPALLVAAVSLVKCPTGVASDPSVRVVVDAYMQGIAKFQRFTCRFTDTYATAKTPSDAVDRKFATPVRVGRYLWVRNGADESYKVIEDEETTRLLVNPKPQPIRGAPHLGGMIHTPHQNREFMTNSRDFIGYVAYGRTANLGADGRPHGSVGAIFGRMNGSANSLDPVCWLDEFLAKNIGIATAGRVREGGEDCVRVTLDYSTAPAEHKRRGKDEYFFVPAKGYLLSKYVTHQIDGPMKMDRLHLCTEMRSVSDGRWFPGRIIKLWKQPQNATWTVNDIEITDLNVDDPPDPKHFEIELPAGTSVTDPRDHKRTFVTKQVERVGLNDLRGMYDMTQKSDATARVPMDTAISRTTGSFLWWWAAAGIGVVVALILARRLLTRRGT
jgi:hypothetical protein